MADRTEVSGARVTEQLRALGVQPGGVLLVHTSFRAIRPVAGGPLGLIAALREALGPAGTLVMPSWSGDENHAFDPRSTRAAEDLGAVANSFWRLPGVLRSPHQEAFAAAGPRAAEMVLRDPLPLPPHLPASPVGRVYEADGHILLLGVGHDADTTVHLAELMAGVPYGILKSCIVMEGGEPVRREYRENDHCCQRFAPVGDWLRERGLQTDGRVGHAEAHLVRSRDVVEVVLRQLAKDPLVFLHSPEEGCEECDEARASISAVPA